MRQRKKKQQWKDHQIKMKLKKLSKTQKNGKAPGVDNIPPGLLTEDIDLSANILCNLFEKKFGNRKKSLKTGEKAFCSNYQRKEMFIPVQIGEELHFFL
jgi:hypothetical protein